MGESRDECLNEHVFDTLFEARRIIDAWRTDYNTAQPHTSLAGLTSVEFAAKAGALATQQAGGTDSRGGSMPPACCSPARKGQNRNRPNLRVAGKRGAGQLYCNFLSDDYGVVEIFL